MSNAAAPLEVLIDELKRLPGIGDKSATRLAYQLMNLSADQTEKLVQAIRGVHTKLNRCRQCQNYTEGDLCPICADPKRDHSTICVGGDRPGRPSHRADAGVPRALPRAVRADQPGEGGRTRKPDHPRAAGPPGRRRGQGGHHGAAPQRGGGTLPPSTWPGPSSPWGVRTTRLASGVPVGSKLEQADRQTIFRALEGPPRAVKARWSGILQFLHQISLALSGKLWYNIYTLPCTRPGAAAGSGPTLTPRKGGAFPCLPRKNRRPRPSPPTAKRATNIS